ncbi:hypothetical protein DRQ33_08600 [bacterium]|nr:MAG: hypothetical protein DRQ33_08600 [bacterium]
MSKIIDIGLYRSAEKHPARMKATSMRKIFTSLLIVLLIVAGGISAYFYYSSKELTGAVAEIPVQPKPKVFNLGDKVAEYLLKWAECMNNLLLINPQSVASDGETFFISQFHLNNIDELDSLIGLVAKAGRIINVIDTFTEHSKLNVILRVRLPTTDESFQPQPVKKFLRTTVMNFLDSLAQSQQLTPISRTVISAEQNVKGGKVFKYRQIVEGDYRKFAIFAGKIKELKYAIAPISYSIEKLANSEGHFDIVWGLYFFAPPTDSSAVASAEKNK